MATMIIKDLDENNITTNLVMIAFLIVRRTPAPAEPAPQTTNLYEQMIIFIKDIVLFNQMIIFVKRYCYLQSDDHFH